MQTPNHQSNRILRPVRPWFIVLSILIALLLNMLPPRQWLFMPDWVLLTLCFWSIREGQKIGMGVAFCLGLFMDVADSAALGQHALAYVIASYTASAFSKRILWFSLPLQALHVFPIFLATSALQIFIQLVAGKDFPGFAQFLPSFVAAALWPLLSFFLLLPQYQPEFRDETRPI
ncbi:MAG: rod shape-determining protein MreD [Zoogloeaceae bacterium]|jgi:rod shape-determining protein MreD|nr:rod shape-determining protein MreD [Zoogloeaceae bacterium]